MDNLNYEYPSSEYGEMFEEEINKMKKGYKKAVKLSLIFLLAGIAFFAAYSLLISFKYAYVLLILFIAMLLISVYSFKASQSAGGFHFLKIKAYDERMELVYYTSRRKTKLEVYYEDIITAQFSDKNHTGFQIVFADNDRSHITTFDEKNRITDNLNNNLFLFKINPMSWEQGFFLYFAEQYFEIDGFEFTKKLKRKYGSAEKYFENLEQ